MYAAISKILNKFLKQSTIFKYGFNISPMYRRSTGKIVEVSDDLYNVKVKIPISYKNRNYVNSIFGGSMFSAVDPIPMVQLINLLDDNFIVWDKSAEIFFKRPAKEDLYADFNYTLQELADIKTRVTLEKEFEIVKTTALTNKDRSIVYCEVKKTIYIADKAYFKNKSKNRHKLKNQIQKD